MYPLSSWAEYFRVHAALIALTGVADIPMMRRIFEGCIDVGLSVDEVDEITSSVFAYDPDRIAAALRVLGDCELRFALLTDCYKMARGARVETPEYEPILRRLAALLRISAEQQRAISWYVWACDPLIEHPWRDLVSEIGAALSRVEEVGASKDAVTETRWTVLRGGAEYTALIRLCREVCPHEIA